MIRQICTKCKKELKIVNFVKGNNKIGLSYHCKRCQKKYHKKFRLKNIERLKECRKKYRETHKKQLIEKYRIYISTTAGVYCYLKSHCKRNKKPFNINKKDFIKWYNNQKQECYYCGRTLEEIKTDIKENNNFKGRLSIDRKDNNKGYELNNIVLACRRCNTIKGDYFTEEEMLKLGRIIYEKS